MSTYVRNGKGQICWIDGTPVFVESSKCALEQQEADAAAFRREHPNALRDPNLDELSQSAIDALSWRIEHQDEMRRRGNASHCGLG